MKNIIKIIALVAIIGFGMSACDNPTGVVPGKTPLAVPANVQVDADASGFFLKWNAVTGAAGYVVEIDGTAQTAVTTTSFSLASHLTEHKVYQLRVKATAPSDSTTLSDSEFSGTIDCEPAVFIFTFQANSPLVITGLTDYGETLEDIVIPEQIGSGEVTSIGAGAFENNTTMTSVVIPATVESVGNNAFAGATALTEITFQSEDPPNFGTGVFDGANSITTITVPADSVGAYEAEIADAAPELVNTITAAAQFTLTVTNGTGGGTFNAGTSVTATATVPAGQVFVRWVEGSTQVSTDNPYTFTLTSNRTLTAVFENASTIITGNLWRLEITQGPTKTAYNEGEVFNPAGISFIAHYSCDGTKVINNLTDMDFLMMRNYNDLFLVSATTSLALHNVTITVSYTDGGFTARAGIPITVVRNEGGVITQRVADPIMGWCWESNVIWFYPVPTGGPFEFVVAGANQQIARWPLNQERGRHEFQVNLYSATWNPMDLRAAIWAHGINSGNHVWLPSNTVIVDNIYGAMPTNHFYVATFHQGANSIQMIRPQEWPQNGQWWIAQAGAQVTLNFNIADGMRIKQGTLGYLNYRNHFTPITGTTFTMPAGHIRLVAEFELSPRFGITVEQPLRNMISSLHNTQAFAGQQVFVTLNHNAHGFQINPALINGVDLLFDTHSNRWYFIMPASAVTISGVLEELAMFAIILSDELQGKIHLMLNNPNNPRAPEGEYVGIRSAHGYKIEGLSSTTVEIKFNSDWDEWYFTMPAGPVHISGTVIEFGERFNINLHEDLIDKVFVNSWALEGDSVWISVWGNVTNLLVNGGAIELMPEGRDAFTFIMPAGEVTITGTVNP